MGGLGGVGGKSPGLSGVSKAGEDCCTAAALVVVVEGVDGGAETDNTKSKTK